MNAEPNWEELKEEIKRRMESHSDKVKKLEEAIRLVSLQLARSYETEGHKFISGYDKGLAVRHTSATISVVGGKELKDLASVVMSALTGMSAYAKPDEQGLSYYMTPVGIVHRATINAAARFVRNVRSGITPNDYSIEKAETIVRHQAAIHYASMHNMTPSPQ